MMNSSFPSREGKEAVAEFEGDPSDLYPCIIHSHRVCVKLGGMTRFYSRNCIILHADVIKVPVDCINPKEITWVGLIASGEPLKGTGTFLKSEKLEGPMEGAVCQGPESHC